MGLFTFSITTATTTNTGATMSSTKENKNNKPWQPWHKGPSSPMNSPARRPRTRSRDLVAACSKIPTHNSIASKNAEIINNHSNNNSAAKTSGTQSASSTPDLQPSIPLPPHRSRFNSRDISHTYAGQYGSGDTDLLPFECMRIRTVSPAVFLSTYLTIFGLVHMISMIVVAMNDELQTEQRRSNLWDHSSLTEFLKHFWDNAILNSWTLTNGMHLLITLTYIHWLKGRDSFFFLGTNSDEQGEMSAMTVWEQLEAVPDTVTIRRMLLIVPTVLTYVACFTTDFQLETCTLNIIVWVITMLGKFPFMNGVRLFGINRTAGIDDYISEDLIDDLDKQKTKIQ